MPQATRQLKYESAYRAVLDRIRSGLYPVGSRIATEDELSRQFAVSRVTIRRALEILVQDGYLESRQGSGYRVVTLSPASDTCLTSFTDQMQRAGRIPTTRLLSIRTLPADAPDLAHLPPAMLTEPITCVERLRRVDGVARMLVRTYAPARLLTGAVPEDFPETGPGQSILRILSGRFGLDWSAACEDISPTLADAGLARLFDLPEGTPMLRQACSAFADDGAIVFHEDVFRTGAVSFNLTRHARQPRES